MSPTPWTGRLVIVAAMIVVFAATYYLQAGVVDPRRQVMLGYRTDLPRAVAHAAAYNTTRAAGEKPLFVPGEQSLDLSDLPSRAAAIGLGGLRGFFSIYLWIEAEDQKNQRVHEDLLNKYHRIANLQPDYPSVYSYHSWNLSANIAAQWSTTERRYEWIKLGVDFLAEGIRRNPRNVDLLEAMGDMYYWRMVNSARSEDKAYIEQQVLKEQGASPYYVAYLWYDRARRIQEETGLAHSALSNRNLQAQAGHAIHEYCHQQTRQALDQLLQGVQLHLAGKTAAAAPLLEAGYGQLARTLPFWDTAVREWQKQVERFPDDFNSRRYTEGAMQSRAIVAAMLRKLTPQLLINDPQAYLAIVKSARDFSLLTEVFNYDTEPPEMYFWVADP